MIDDDDNGDVLYMHRRDLSFVSKFACGWSGRSLWLSLTSRETRGATKNLFVRHNTRKHSRLFSPNVFSAHVFASISL